MLLSLVALTMLELGLAFVVSMSLFTAAISDALIKLTIYALGACLVMTLVSVAPIVGMQLKSAAE